MRSLGSCGGKSASMGFGAAVIVALGAVGCGESEVVTRARALAAPVEDALAGPTGVADARTVRALLSRTYGDGVAGVSDGIAAAIDAAPSACVSRGAEGDERESVDLGCATDGQLVGSIVVESDASGDDAFVLVEYRSACSADLRFCMDGEGAFVIRSRGDDFSDVVNGNEVDVTRGEETTHERFGFAAVEPRAGAVFFTEDGSFVIGPTPSIDLEGESFVTVVGANGELSCRFVDRGEHGACDGPTAFDW